MTGTGVQKSYKEQDVYRYLFVERQAKKRSLRDLADEFGVSHGVIQRALKGEFPKRKDIRMRLKLVPLEEVEACPKCGVVHTTKRCNNSNSKRYSRIAIRLDNPESAANSIMRNMGTMERDELIELLMEQSDTVYASRRTAVGNRE